MESFNKIRIPIVILVIFLVIFEVNHTLIKHYRKLYDQTYIAAIADKNQLLANTPSPKIIILGGSSAAFGFDSDRISKATGLPVVNMGLQGSLGLNFILNEVKPYIHANDIILLAPEYNLLYFLKGGDVLAEGLLFDPKGFWAITSVNDMIQLAISFPHIHTNAIRNYLEERIRGNCAFFCNPPQDRTYFRTAFSPSTGDITTNKGRDIHSLNSTFAFSLHERYPNLALWCNVHFFNSFTKFVESKGAKIYFAYPPISSNFDNKTSGNLQLISLYLQKNMRIPILGELGDSYFSSDYLYDTPYHLNDQGREIRTVNVLAALCPIIEGGCKQIH